MQEPPTPLPSISPAEMQILVSRAGLVLNPGQVADLVLAWRQVAVLIASIPHDRPLADDMAVTFRLPPPTAAEAASPASTKAQPARKVAPARVAPAKAAPTKASASKAAGTKAARTKAAPAKAASTQPAPTGTAASGNPARPAEREPAAVMIPRKPTSGRGGAAPPPAPKRTPTRR